MAYETKNNTGALFKNDKQGNDRRPDYTGTCLVGDQEYRMSAWINTSKNGVKYMSMTFQPSESQPVTPKPAYGELGTSEDDIPF